MFGIAFWKIAVSLGVPGFALAIFLVLFSKFNFTIPAIPKKHTTWVVTLFMLIVAIVVLFALHTWGPNPPPDAYTIRVTVLDPDGNPVDDAEVTSGLGGESKKVQGGWEFVIPQSSVPNDGTLTIFARHVARGLSGTAQSVLRSDTSVSVALNMTLNTSAEIAGYVRDEQSAGIAGARVTHTGGEATTDAQGRFRFPANAVKGSEVRLHVEHDGYTPNDQYAVAGDESVIILLRRQTP